MGFVAWFALVAFIVVATATTLAWARRLDIVRPALIGLLAQGAITVGLYHLIGLWAPDAVVYDELGREFAAFWGGGPDPSAVSNGKEAFPVMLGAIYFVVGPAPAIGLALNWAAHGLLIPMLASLSKRLDLPIKPTAWIAALFPPLLFWSAFMLRETITWLLMAVFLYAVVGVARRVNFRDVAILVASLAALMWFRGPGAIILAGVSMVVLVLTARRKTLLPRFGVALLTLLVLSPRLASLLFGYTTVGDIEAKRTDLSNAGTSFDSGGVSGGGGVTGGGIPGGDGGVSGVPGDDGGLVSSLFDSVLRVALGPYPWEWPSLGAPFALDAALWLAILGLAVWGWWRASNRLVLLLVVMPALAISGALMLTSGNYGTMQRLRVQTTVLLIPLAAAGLSLGASRLRSGRASLARRRASEPADSLR